MIIRNQLVGESQHPGKKQQALFSSRAAERPSSFLSTRQTSSACPQRRGRRTDRRKQGSAG
jgi:hypothetical protein